MSGILLFDYDLARFDERIDHRPVGVHTQELSDLSRFRAQVGSSVCADGGTAKRLSQAGGLSLTRLDWTVKNFSNYAHEGLPLTKGSRRGKKR